MGSNEHNTSIRMYYRSGTGVRYCTGARQTLCVHAPGGSTFLRKMTSSHSLTTRPTLHKSLERPPVVKRGAFITTSAGRLDHRQYVKLWRGWNGPDWWPNEAPPLGPATYAFRSARRIVFVRPTAILAIHYVAHPRSHIYLSGDVQTRGTFNHFNASGDYISQPIHYTSAKQMRNVKVRGVS